MSSFEAQIEKSRKEIAEGQAKVAELSSKIESTRSKIKMGSEIGIDIDTASFDEIHSHAEMMNGNIAELILGLDDVTSGFSKEFSKMEAFTGWEKIVGIFSKDRKKIMRAERIRKATIEAKLQDLLQKSNTIEAMLSEQLNELHMHRDKVEGNLASSLTEREAAVSQLEQIKAELLALDPKTIELENKLAAETNAKARSRLESELAALNSNYNELAQAEQVKLAESQTLERYIEQGKTWLDSLQNQAATQTVLINKLNIDTKNRVILYDALVKSLKTAQQQDVAHQINEIGVATDKEAQVAMAAIGAATNNRMADMMETHEDHIVFARKVTEEKIKADERFARRFEKIVEMHDKNAYGQGTVSYTHLTLPTTPYV